MQIPTFILGPGSLVLALALTFVLPIQRGKLRNQVWDLITFALFVVAAYWINYWVPFENIVVGVIAGAIAILVRDFRLWMTRFKDLVYRRGHRYYWYGRARDMYRGRRRY